VKSRTRFTGKPIRSALVLLAIFTSHPVRAAVTTRPSSTLQTWADQLGGEDRAARDAAETNLIAAGKPARDLLRLAENDPRPEVAARARRALRKIELFLLPDMSDEALSIAQAYLSAPDAEHRKPQLNRLFQMVPQPDAVLTRLIPLEDDEDLIRQILYQLRIGYRDAVPRMLVDDDDLPAVLQVLDLSAEMWGGQQAADDAVALILCGQIDQQIAICSAEQVNGDTTEKEHAATQLCFLYRACGKYSDALKYARLSRDQSLIFLVLQDMGDWSAAAKEPDERWREPIVAASYRAAFQRLAGHPQAEVAIMSGLSAGAANDADPASFAPSRMFLLNDMPERGMELLVDQHPAVVFEMRVERGEIAQAIGIAQKYQKHPQEGTLLAGMYEELQRNLGELPEPASQPVGVAGPDLTPVDRAWQQAVTDLNRKKFQIAADEFAAMWSIDQLHFDRLYLEGYALQQTGQPAQVDRGKALMREAEMLPLGDPGRRWQFAAQLEAAGLTDAADRQRDLGLRGGGDFDELGFSDMYNTRAQEAMDRRQWPAAADALDRLCLINLSARIQWVDPVRLLTVPALAHLVHARMARERGDFLGMNQQLQMYQQYLPMSSDMVLEMAPALDELGRHDAADALFDGVYGKVSAICQAYPKSVTYLNQMAWMCACCDRHLDEGLKAAETTVQLQPDNWQVMDTLAEVHFRRGERAAAVDQEKRAMKINADPYLTRQLKRFEEAAIPDVSKPGMAPE
jgi:hypothetical protein